jgi:hypothetical protein
LKLTIVGTGLYQIVLDEKCNFRRTRLLKSYVSNGYDGMSLDELDETFNI